MVSAARRAEIRRQWEETGRCAAPTTGANGYKLGCRCDGCRNGHRERMQEQRDKRERLRLAGKMPKSAHGPSGYANWGCRCKRCTEGHAERVAAARAEEKVESSV